MATIVPGYTFGPTEQVTNTKLAALASGTVTGIVQADFGSSFSGITSGTSAPPTQTGAAWFDTTQGAGEGILKIFDNGRWTAIAQGFLGYNNGTSLARGHIVQYDSTLTPAVVGTIPISKTAAPVAGVVQLARPIGVAAEAMANGVYGVVITRGYCTVLKEAGTVTTGDIIVPSSTVGASSNGRGESGNVGSWGGTGGHAAIGRWMETSSAAADTEVAASIYMNSGSWTAFKNNGGTVVYSAITPAAFGSWQGTNAFATNVPGTIAHICQVIVTKTATSTNLVVGLRMVGSTVDIGTGAASFGGTITAGASATKNSLRAQLIVPETTGTATNQLQYYVDGVDTTVLTLTVNEVGVIVGGSIA